MRTRKLFLLIFLITFATPAFAGRSWVEEFLARYRPPVSTESQAVAAFAYGTASVPRADKIVGPGNRFVAAAKKLVAGDCGIDFIAGPTELVVVGGRGKAAWIASDLVAQAEHDPDAVTLFFTPSRALAVQVREAAGALVARLGIRVAEDSLGRWGAIVVTGSLTEAIALANSFAPEHLAPLIDSARQGSREALGQLLEGYREYLLNQARHALSPYLRSKVGASELVQETLLAALQKFPDFKGCTDKELAGWLAMK